MNWRRLWVGVGVACVLVGLAVVVVPSLAVEAGPNLLTVIGIVAGLAGVAAVYERVTTESRRVDPPTPERRRSFPSPGEGFDRQLASLGPRNRGRSARGERAVRDRLADLAVAVLVRDGVSESTARDRLAEGTWTEDPHAAAFFAEARASEIPLEERLRAAFSSEPNERRRARHAVDALSRIAETGAER